MTSLESESQKGRVVPTIECSDATDFLARVQPWSATSLRGRCIYRGVGSAGHMLVPQALRPGMADALQRLAHFDHPISSEFEQRAVEQRVVLLFFMTSHENGLSPSEVPIGLRNFLLRRVDRPVFAPSDNWPQDDLIETAALAQHYGLPTRLLDWTRDPLVAAYFAARSGVRRLLNLRTDGTVENFLEQEPIALWLLDLNETAKLGEESPLIVCAPPYTGNPNLAAQRGVLTTWRHQSSQGPVDRTPFDEQLLGVEGVGDPYRPLKKFTLPLICAPVLLRLLIHQGIGAARLFPGFDGVTRAIQELSDEEEAHKFVETRMHELQVETPHEVRDPEVADSDSD